MAFFGRKEEPQSERLRFYVYVSDTKIDMLLAQIPLRLMQRLASEITIDLKLLSLKVATRDAPETRFSRTALVSRYLANENLVGDIGDNAAQYFAGDRIAMRWGLVGDPGIAFFGGAIGSLRVYLTGSPRHIIGYPPHATVDHSHPASYRPPLDVFWHVFADWDESTRIKESAYEYAPQFVKGLGDGPTPRPLENLSFLARKIERRAVGGVGTIFGSPLWVAAEALGE